MKLGIIGYAGSGKTTVFNVLTGLRADTGFGAKKANLGVTKVPDARIDFLAGAYEPKKVTYAEIHFEDMPGKAPTKTSGGLDAQVVGELRTMDALALVLRGFETAALDAKADPQRDYGAMEAELLLADLAIIEKRLERMKKEKGNEREKEALEACMAHIELEKPLRTLDLLPDQWELLKGYRFLTQKALLVLVNTSEEAPAPELPDLDDRLAAQGLSTMKLCATIEAEIADLPPEEQQAFLSDLGVTESAKDRFIRTAYDALNLMSFLTAGKDECRAWTIQKGTRAQDAAGKIHSDIARGFIRAEVIAFDDFKKYGDEQKAKAAGRYRLEGKDYIVKDGDIINFRFNV
jgi:GTP-binding protein YchF